MLKLKAFSSAVLVVLVAIGVGAAESVARLTRSATRCAASAGQSGRTSR